MIAVILTILIIISCACVFFMKFSILKAFTAVVSVFLGMAVAFGYYEVVADILISRGHIIPWAHAVSFALLSIIGYAVIFAVGDYLIGSDIKFGGIIDRVVLITCGLVCGMLVSGLLLITGSLAPISSQKPYPRFGEAGASLTSSTIRNAKHTLGNPDGFVAGVFGRISKGSLGSGKSFALYHADFVDQTFLNRHKVKDNVHPVAGKDALFVPPGIGVRLYDVDDKSLTVVRIGINSDSISEGGAASGGDISFTLSQVRLICKEEKASDKQGGSGTAVYPQGLMLKRKMVEKDLGEIIEVGRNDIETKFGHSQAAWYDVVFDVPGGVTPVMIEFKRHCVTQLPEPVTTTVEIENQLNAAKSPSASEDEGEGDGEDQ